MRLLFGHPRSLIFAAYAGRRSGPIFGGGRRFLKSAHPSSIHGFRGNNTFELDETRERTVCMTQVESCDLLSVDVER
jgi:hypothetical protein